MSAQEYKELHWHLKLSDDVLPLEDPPIDMDEAAIVKYLKDIGLCRRGIDNHCFLPDSEKINWRKEGERGVNVLGAHIALGQVLQRDEGGDDGAQRHDVVLHLVLRRGNFKRRRAQLRRP